MFSDSPDFEYGNWIAGSNCGEDADNAMLIAALIGNAFQPNITVCIRYSPLCPFHACGSCTTLQ